MLPIANISFVLMYLACPLLLLPYTQFTIKCAVYSNYILLEILGVCRTSTFSVLFTVNLVGSVGNGTLVGFKVRVEQGVVN